MATPKTVPSYQAPPAQSVKSEGAARPMLQVISLRDGFRRAGRAWSGATAVALDALTRQQYEQITREPLLVTQLLEPRAAAAAADDGNA